VDAAKIPADTLRHVLDKTCASFAGVLVSEQGDRIAFELDEWSRAAAQAADDAEYELGEALRQVPETVTKYRWEWVPD